MAEEAAPVGEFTPRVWDAAQAYSAEFDCWRIIEDEGHGWLAIRSANGKPWACGSVTRFPDSDSADIHAHLCCMAAALAFADEMERARNAESHG